MKSVAHARSFANALDPDGVLPGVCYIPSPNCDERPIGEVVRLIVIHAISLPPGVFGGDGIVRLFTNSLDPGAHPYYESIHALHVSAHFLVRRDGALIQFVPCSKRAWHAGVSSWQGRQRCNDFSIGIELEGCDDRPFEDAQYQSLADLLDVLRRRYGHVEIAGHSDVAPGRKTDPGPCFDWSRIESNAASCDPS